MTERSEQIVYLTEWAARYGCTLQVKGTVGIGRDCVGILSGSHYIDTTEIKDAEAYHEGGVWWEPEDSYHKHNCLSVLDHGDNEKALTQLYEWVKWLDEHGYGIEETYRKPSSNIDAVFHGLSLARIVKLAPHRADVLNYEHFDCCGQGMVPKP